MPYTIEREEFKVDVYQDEIILYRCFPMSGKVREEFTVSKFELPELVEALIAVLEEDRAAPPVGELIS